MLVDGQPATYFLSQASAGVSVVLDMGDARWVTALRITPIGDSRTPQRCVLQHSITGGVGPFETVRSFTLTHLGPRGASTRQGNASDYEEQRISGFSGYARYWRLVVIDNYGGVGVGIREIQLEGYDETVTPVPFLLNNTGGSYTSYYLPINSYLTGTLLRMRLELLYLNNNEDAAPHKSGKLFRESLYIDHIRVVRAPEVWKVRGCLEKYYASASYQDPQYNVTAQINVINGNLPVHYFDKNNLTLQYATTYDCPTSGGTVVLIEGINFGMHPLVYIGGNECPVISNKVWSVEGRVQQLSCVLPPGRSGLQRVKVVNGVHPGKLRVSLA
jgi:hypothetical protein